MKKRFLPLLIAVFVLMTAVTAHAAVKIEQYNTTLTGDESVGVELKEISSAAKNSYGRVGITPKSVVTVEDDGTGNYAYKVTGGQAQAKQQMAFNLYGDITGTKADGFLASNKNSGYHKMTARVYLSSLTGTVQLFDMNRAFNSALNSDTAGVYFFLGGAQYYDASTSMREYFIEPGTLQADKWYTVEAIYDVSVTQEVYMKASVYDENGMIMGTSPMAKVSTLKWYSGTVRYMRAFLSATDLGADDYVLFDDIAVYRLDSIPEVSAPTAEYDEENGVVKFTFADDVDTGIITESNVKISASNPALDLTDKYTIAVEGDTVSVDVSKLPYSETFTVSMLGWAINGTSEIEVTTPEDPFENAVVGASYVEEDDSVVAIVDIANTSAIDRDYMFVITSWNTKNECVAIRALTGFIAAGETDDVELPAVPFKNEGDTIRISLVDNWLNMTPIGDALEYTLGGE